MNPRVVAPLATLALAVLASEARAVGEPLQHQLPEVLRHLLSAGTTVVEVQHDHRDYDRNGRDGHHHRQVDAFKRKRTINKTF